jgi:hypothetical protein
MSNLSTKPLDTGDHFPALSLKLLNGDEVLLPDFVGPDYGLFLVYRGHW